MLIENKTICHIDLSGNECLGDDLAIRLSCAIFNRSNRNANNNQKQNRSIISLDVSYCGLTDIGIQILCQTIALTKTLHTLNLSGNRISSVGHTWIATSCSAYSFNDLVLHMKGSSPLVSAVSTSYRS